MPQRVGKFIFGKSFIHKKYKSIFKLISVIILMYSLTACGFGGGVYVDMGSHEEQDEVMIEKLLQAYPKLEFTCVSSEVTNVHQVLASDGTEFPVWVVALRRDEWQITEHYSEEWLIQNGWYDTLCERLAAVDMTVKFSDFNNYAHNIIIECGELTEDRHAQLIQVLYGAKEDFDTYMPEFMEGCGTAKMPAVDISVRFTKNGEQQVKVVPMGSTNAIYSSFGPYEYEGYFRHYMDEDAL